MTLTSPLQTINHPDFVKAKITVMIKRDDLIHPIISGNKWRKLKYNIALAKQQNKTGIVSFGGAYSNHIHALAFACYQQNISCTAIIRGEAHYQNNFTLRWAKHWGMNLVFVDRITYKKRDNPEYLQALQHEYIDHLIVPEGGSNSHALQGMGEVIEELNQQTCFDTLITPVGSGGTLAGLITADNDQHQLLGIAVLKADQPSNFVDSAELHTSGYLTDEVKKLLPVQAKKLHQWKVLSEFHRGGYAKFSAADCQRIIDFNQITQLTFEPVYSGKMLLALLDLIALGYFPEHHRIVLLHTGGLQGLGGLAERKIIDGDLWQVPDNAPKV